MKNLKKLFAVLAAIMMVLTLGTTAVKAEDEEGHTITVKETAETHTFKIYQIFTGETKADSNEFSAIKYGFSTTKNAGEAVLDTDVEAVKSLSGADDAATIAKVAPFVDLTKPFKTVSSGDEVKLPTGYYLFQDDTKNLSDESVSLYVLHVVDKDEEISPKIGTVTHEKKLKDINDSESADYTDWQDSSDYDIGDDVPYQLYAKLAGNVTDYTKYHITFVDTLEAGKLKNNKDYKVTIKYNDGTTADLTSAATITKETNDGFELKLEWMGTVKEEKDGKTIYNQIANEKLNGAEVFVEFSAELLEGANLGDPGNRNTSKVKFSNNPNTNDDGTPKDDEGETPEDTVITFTYKVVVNKKNENNEDLNGATFSLYKKLAVAPTGADAPAECTEEGYEGYYLVKTIAGDESSVFEFKGLDDGLYVLVEDVAPTNYNKIAPQAFKVEAAHVTTADVINKVGTDSNGDEILTSLTGDCTSGEITFTPADDHSQLSTDVINRFGAVLPETGGIGTTIFYTVGGLLVIGAIIMLIQKRRMAE